ncbi:MAG: efflux RND transporter periplasmic adaptor subunit [Dialister sp.]|nr:efflux RND transporter periplasmic adaptor subunit [Dialister sp.]
MNRKYMIAVVIGVLAIFAAGYYWYEGNHQAQKDTYTLGMVGRETVSATVSATGTIEPVESVGLSATASGTLENVYVKQNETVHKGQVLARIESKALTSTQKQAQNTLENKKSYYERLLSLYNQGAISYQEMDNARMDYLNAQAAFDKAKADVNDTVIISPMDGTVIGEPMKEGETVSQGLSSQMVIMTVADLSSMQIKLLVDETDIGEVAIGQSVEFTVDAYPDKTFHGIVDNISKKSYSSSSASLSSSVVYYTVYVAINPDELEGLYPSMTARAEIRGRSSENALVVPVTALRSDTKGSYVYVEKNGDLEKSYVQTGITTDKSVEIKSGLSEGDSIVISGTVSQETTGKAVTKNQRGGHPL